MAVSPTFTSRRFPPFSDVGFHGLFGILQPTDFRSVVPHHHTVKGLIRAMLVERLDLAPPEVELCVTGVAGLAAKLLHERDVTRPRFTHVRSKPVRPAL